MARQRGRATEASDGTRRPRWGAPSAATSAIAGTVLLWSSAFVGIRYAVRSMSPVGVAVVRYAVASAVLAVVMVVLRKPLPPLRTWPRLAVVGFLGITVYNLALNYGSVYIQAGAVGFLINTAPLFTAVLAVFLLREKLHARVYWGIAFGIAGAVLILLGQGAAVAFGWPAAAILLAAVAQSLYFVLQKPVLVHVGSLHVVSFAVWVGTLLMLPVARGAFGEFAAAPAAAKAAVIYLGVLPSALAYFLWSYALARTEASIATTFLYAVPPTTVVLGWAVLGEVPAVLSLVGGAVALAGVFVVNRSRPRP